MATTPRIAVISFPGNNCEVETIRSINRCGMQAVPFRWNDDIAKLENIDGYFLPGGFSYEDRGRAGMIAARDKLFGHIGNEASKGKVVVGNCNGAQMLIESGLVPCNQGLRMSLAKNVHHTDAGIVGTGFLGEWVHITVSSSKDRCACSNWDGVMHIPIAHGEGRFTTKNPEVIEQLKANDQIVFSYCDENGTVSPSREITPNGSLFSIAGICNPEGNVVALMPHPERTVGSGEPYFHSIREWIVGGTQKEFTFCPAEDTSGHIQKKAQSGAVEVFIDTIIVNNEERTVEKAAQMYMPGLSLVQMKYFSLPEDTPEKILSSISMFNPNKEIAYIRRGETISKWNPDLKKEQEVSVHPLDASVVLVRRDEPDTGASHLGSGFESGVCYAMNNVNTDDIASPRVLEIFANPHASTLETLV